MVKNCLNCKYEPDWSDWGKWKELEYGRQIGKCKFRLVLPVLPAVFHLVKTPIIRYHDNTGIENCCRAWEAKK